MTTKYIAQLRVYTDCEGYHSKFTGNKIVDTLDEAIVIAESFPKYHEHSGFDTGDWRIIKKTMDEATFSITEEIVKEYNGSKIEGQKVAYKAELRYYEMMLAETLKKRPRTEKGHIKKAEDIKKFTEEIAICKKYLNI